MGISWLLACTCFFAVAHAFFDCPSTLSNISMCTNMDTIYTIHIKSKHYPECGANINGSDNVQKQPQGIQFKEANSNTNYTLIMVDPDAPSRDRSNGFYWLHWLGSKLQNENMYEVESEHVMMEYHPPTPPRKTGYHRYQMFLIPQDKPFSDNNLVSTRSNFELANFVNSSKFRKPWCGTGAATYEYNLQNIEQ